MSETGPPLLILSGPVGVGKTSVGHAVHELLIAAQVPSTFVDFDALVFTWPAPDDEDHFNLRLGCTQLGSMWNNAAAVGSRNLVVAEVVEHAWARDAIAGAVQASSVVVAGLRASLGTLRARVAGREHGTRLEWHLAWAAELHAEFTRDDPADVVLDTDDRSVEEVAAECVGLVSWL